jgi:uncharacterized protein YneF (UPF0154 family)
MTDHIVIVILISFIAGLIFGIVFTRPQFVH